MKSVPLKNKQQYLLLFLALLSFSLLILLPLFMIFFRAFMAWESLPLLFKNHDFQAALWLSLRILLWTVPINLFLALALGWLLTHYSFKGQSLFLLSVDVPLVISPMIAGMAFLLMLSSEQSPLGIWLEAHGIQLLFSLPSMVLVTCFVSFPYLAREIISSMRQRGSDAEITAWSLGAHGWKIFLSISLPALKSSIVYGLLMSMARAFGEYGAVSVVSGRIRGRSISLSLLIQQFFEDESLDLAFLLASLLLLTALLTVFFRMLTQPRRKT